MIKKVFSLVLIFFLSLLAVFGMGDKINLESAAFMAFEKSGAVLEEVNVNCYIILEDFLSIDNVKKVCNDISERLDMTVLEESTIEEEGLYGLILQGLINDKTPTTLIVQSVFYDDFRESTVVLDILENEKFDITGLCEKIRSTLGDYGDVKFTTTITGSFKDRFTTMERENIIKGIFNELGIREVEGISDGELTSISGYMPAVSEYLSFNNKKININIALRYNSYEGKTNIWIGTPIIVKGY